MATNDIYSLADLLAYTFTPASEFGLDSIARTLQARVNYLNSEIDGMTSLLAERSTDRKRVWGAGNVGTMVKLVDDLGSAKSERFLPGVEVGFPMYKFSAKLAKSKEWMKRATPADIAKTFTGIEASYLNAIVREIRTAVFNDDNYTFKDFLTDNTDLAVKAFLNADSAAIPPAPDGTTFTASTHTHYKGTAGASLAYTDIDALIENVREHGLSLGLALFVNAADVSVLAGLASTKFVAVTHNVLVPANASVSTVSRDDPANYDLNNRLAGFWDESPSILNHGS